MAKKGAVIEPRQVMRGAGEASGEEGQLVSVEAGGAVEGPRKKAKPWMNYIPPEMELPERVTNRAPKPYLNYWPELMRLEQVQKQAEREFRAAAIGAERNPGPEAEAKLAAADAAVKAADAAVALEKQKQAGKGAPVVDEKELEERMERDADPGLFDEDEGEEDAGAVGEG